MFNGGSTSLKYYKRLKVYKNSTGTVEFDPETKRGRSYNWTFLAEVNGRLVFNDYNWSPTTSSHQSAVHHVLRELGLKAIVGDFGPVDVPYMERDATRGLLEQIYDLEVRIESSRNTESWAHKSRVAHAARIRENIATLEALDPKRFKVSAKERRELRTAAEFKELDRISKLEADKCFKFLSLKNMSEDLNALNLGEV